MPTDSLKSALSATMKDRAIQFLALLVASLLMVYLITDQLSRPACLPGAERPARVDLAGLEPFAPANLRALVKFAGYLKYTNASRTLESGRAYLELELDSVGFRAGSRQGVQSFKRLTLETNCAQLELELKQQAGRLLVDRINIELGHPDGQFTECSVAYLDLATDLGKHYACNAHLAYQCDAPAVDDYGRRRMKTVAHLHLLALEFEVEGNRKRVRQRSFSTEASHCIAGWGLE